MGYFVTRLPTIVSSVKLPAGNRTYFLDLESHSGIGSCLVINESKRLAENKFERHRIIVDQGHLEPELKTRVPHVPVLHMGF